MLSTAMLLAASMVVGQSGEDALKSYTDFAIGGVWTTTVDNETVEHTYRKIADGRFVQLTAKGGSNSFVGIVGVDPDTTMCTWWTFGHNGSVIKFTMVRESDATWLCEGGGSSPDGTVQWKFRIRRIDDNTLQEEGIEVEVNGQKQEPRTFTWTRKRPPAKK